VGKASPHRTVASSLAIVWASLNKVGATEDEVAVDVEDDEIFLQGHDVTF
jgi:hypothetical protein